MPTTGCAVRCKWKPSACPVGTIAGELREGYAILINDGRAAVLLLGRCRRSGSHVGIAA